MTEIYEQYDGRAETRTFRAMTSNQPLFHHVFMYDTRPPLMTLPLGKGQADWANGSGPYMDPYFPVVSKIGACHTTDRTYYRPWAGSMPNVPLGS